HDLVDALRQIGLVRAQRLFTLRRERRSQPWRGRLLAAPRLHNESDVVRPDRAAAVLALARWVRLRIHRDDDALALLPAKHAAPLRDDLLLGDSGRIGDAGLPRQRDRGAEVVPR